MDWKSFSENYMKNINLTSNDISSLFSNESKVSKAKNPSERNINK